EIIATRIANRFVNRLGVTAPFALTEEEGASLAQAAAAFVACERLFDMRALWRQLDEIPLSEPVRVELFDEASRGLQLHIADMLRCVPATMKLQEIVETLAPGIDKLYARVDDLL